MRKNSFICLVALLSSVVIVGACGGSSASSSDTNTAVITPTPTVNPVSASCNPVRMAKAFDQTGSMGWTNIKRVKIEELKPVLPLLLRCGGEISVTFIRSESNRPMFRFFIPDPKPEPSLIPRSDDEEPYKFTDRKKKFEKEHLDWENEKTNREEIYSRKFEDFLAEIEPVLSAEPKGKTDFWGAVQRAKIMLSESKVIWKTEPHSYFVLVSDGVDTVGKPKLLLDEKIKVLWVDSKTDNSILKELHADRYESFDSALASVLAIEGGQENGRR